MSKYLLEVGCEELPYKFIPSAINQLKTGFENFLNSNKVEFEDVKVYATPRRLAVIVSGLDKESKDEVKIVKGPIKKVAYDESKTILEDARRNATKVINNALAKAERIESEAESLRRKVVVYKRRFRALVEAQLDEIEGFDEKAE